MLPRNLISASLALTAFVLSFFSNDKSIAEEKRKLNLEQDKVYEHVIKPILSANCTTCHGSSKAKGKIRLHNPEEIKKSESIVEGNIDESTLIERIMLPDDDEDVMPPDGKKRLSPEQKKMLSWWIAEGANFEKTISEVNIPIWLLLCTGFGALFVLLIKRLTEIKSNYLKSAVIKNYRLSRLHLLIISSELLTYFSYLFYCISSNLFPSLKANTPSDYSLLFTMPFVVFGMRYYKYLSLNNDKGDQPEVIIFKNKLLILNFILWVSISSLIIFYRI